MIETKKHFDVLSFLHQTQGMKYSQRAISSQTNISLGTINQILKELVEAQLLSQNGSVYLVSDKGYQALLPYRVKRAIILADGFDQRLLPLTANMPFALATIHGHRVIETILQALQKANIEEIYIVKGYLGEEFKVLQKLYPNVQFIQNPYDLHTKSIMSLYMAKEHLSQTYIIDGNICILNSSIIKEYEYTSCLYGVQADWCDCECYHSRKGMIQRMEQGGRHIYEKVGITYLNEEDAKKLVEDVELLMQMPGGKQKNYDEVFFQTHSQRYVMALKTISAESLLKVSSYQELQRIDITYDRNQFE